MKGKTDMSTGLKHWIVAITFLLCLNVAATAEDLHTSVVYTLDDIRLGNFLQNHLHVTVDDHGINLGSIGSDLWHAPEDGPGVYWLLGDRGPNGQIRVEGKTRRTFPVPDYTPFILKVKAEAGRIQILEVHPITAAGTAASSVTGLSNTSRDETPYNCDASTELPVHPHGLDPEGLVRTRDGTFWVVEEYSPSIVKVDRHGQVRKRWVPVGLMPPTVTAGYETVEALPAILGKRKVNRGFEGATLSPDQHTLYAVVQSPLLNPDRSTGDASRNVRLIAFDIPSETVVDEFVYRLQPVKEFADTNPAEMKVSGLAMLDEHRMLVLERTDKIAKVYRVDLRTATNILGSRWDSAATTPSLEALDDEALAAYTVNVLAKTLLVELDSAQGFPEKIEGIAILDSKTIVVSNDNDFGIGSFTTDSACRLIDSGSKNHLVVLEMQRPLLE
jgi:hypothetical protein